jgi:hypothetical protein
MTDFDPVAASPTATTVTERSGATAGTDTVPGGSRLLIRNTGAGAHVVTLVTNNTSYGLPVTDNAITIPAAGVRYVYVPMEFADTNGRVGIGVDAAPTEVKYCVLGL